MFLCDCDGILTNFIQGVINLAYSLTPLRKTIPTENYRSHHVFDTIAEELRIDRNLLISLINKPGFCRGLQPYNGARGFIEGLQAMGQEVVLVTSPWDSPTWQWERSEWVKEHLGLNPRKSLVSTTRKDLVVGDYLLDDRVDHLVSWLAVPGTGPRKRAFLMNPIPVDTPAPSSVTRVQSYQDVLAIVQKDRWSLKHPSREP